MPREKTALTEWEHVTCETRGQYVTDITNLNWEVETPLLQNGLRWVKSWGDGVGRNKYAEVLVSTSAEGLHRPIEEAIHNLEIR